VGDEKIAAMGLHLSHWVSTHGFALNLDNDLASFSWIVPCGLHGRGVTTMEKLLGAPVERGGIEEQIIAEVAEIFGREPKRMTPADLEAELVRSEGGGQEVAAPGGVTASK
jgi:lipoate-protein ligase B